jgi:hypothetical protein
VKKQIGLSKQRQEQETKRGMKEQLNETEKERGREKNYTKKAFYCFRKEEINE